VNKRKQRREKGSARNDVLELALVFSLFCLWAKDAAEYYELVVVIEVNFLHTKTNELFLFYSSIENNVFT
jgi:hypothetical protein